MLLELTKTSEGESSINKAASLRNAAMEPGDTDHSTESNSSSAEAGSRWTSKRVVLGAGPITGSVESDIHLATSLGLPTVADRPIRWIGAEQ